MKRSLENLVADIEQARQHYLDSVSGLTTQQGDARASDDLWSIAQITEHLVVAEQGGINSMWKAAESVRIGQPLWPGESTNAGLTIEAIVERTWRPEEIAPELARPRQGGPLAYWAAALRSCQMLLPPLLTALDGLDLHAVIWPHPISGPLDVPQRLEFLRFHLDRHRAQVQHLKQGER